MDAIEEIKNKINSIPYDLKAEVLLSSLLESYNRDGYEFLINYEGQFKRPYSTDVLGCEIVDYDYDATQFLKINISRDGIYDALPEGVFHYPKTERLNQSVDDMTKEYRLQQKEEENARKFFLPFENEFFLNGMVRDAAEKDFLFRLNQGHPIDFFLDFWNIDRGLPHVLVAKFIRLLPFVHKVVGKLDKTAFCLEYLLGEKVEIVELGYQELAESNQNVTLDNCRLGLDMVSGMSYMDYSLNIELKIGPLENSSFKEYIHDGGVRRFIDLFYEYFLPVEIDVKTTILLPIEIEQFNFIQEPVLGITTRI
ncbi:type VI secretion system baseplate subunit TssG [Flavobacterium amniphilum]|uniref:type VI secretion system baseplate subunit TssG n=1 Tax=Flavobacterium amniphilum TaxID=1834035 RepID=UPI00202A8B53|nr:type VI secretion system baseplate subunit TssG [Flavobacterium amniphilum]MCL9805330.1 type VI secretion system baseplate subunit TssG [Flavobacterium amniphilum]